MLFNEIMKSKREELGLTRYELAKRCGVHRMTLEKIENKKVKSTSFEYAVRIARELDIDLNDFK